MAGKLENEVKLLEQYNNDIQSLVKQLGEADSQGSKSIQKELERRFDIYWKQIHLVKTSFPDADGVDAGNVHEACFYCAQAMTKFFSSGAMRRMADKADGTAVKLATGMIAKHQEKNNALEALGLIDKALGVFDYANARFAKAQIYYIGLDQKENALKELNYIIANFQDDETYLAARQMKDEIENPPKKGGCFVATAVYGSPIAPEVMTFRRFRDERLLSSKIGKSVVDFYYAVSPPLAALIAKSAFLKAITRKLLLEPALRLLKSSSSSKP